MCADSTIDPRKEQWVCIKCLEIWANENETLAIIAQVFREEGICYSEWHAWFKVSQTFIGNDEHTGKLISPTLLPKFTNLFMTTVMNHSWPCWQGGNWLQDTPMDSDRWIVILWLLFPIYPTCWLCPCNFSLSPKWRSSWNAQAAAWHSWDDPRRNEGSLYIFTEHSTYRHM